MFLESLLEHRFLVCLYWWLGLRVEKLILKSQICVYQQTRALDFWPSKFFKHAEINTQINEKTKKLPIRLHLRLVD